MHFRIGPWVYTVLITEDPIFDEQGAELAGRCIWETHQILISGHIPIARRLETLFHELRHAWKFHLGVAVDEEGDANNVASFSAFVMRELNRQGGEPALWRMVPPGKDLTEDARTQLEHCTGPATGAECGECGTKFAAGAIVNSIPIHDPRFGKLVIGRALYCEHCGHVQEWIEGATQAGMPNGQVLRAPVYKRGADVAEFLRQNGDILGVVSVQ